MTKDEYFKLCTALVQEQVYAWGIASSFVCLGSPPGMADAMLLKPNWSILQWDEKELDPQITPNVYFWTPNSEILAKTLVV